MTLDDYKTYLKQLTFGKILPDAIYVHIESFIVSGSMLVPFIDQTFRKLKISPEYNLIKFYKNEFKLSFLHYPNFFEDPHPHLEASIHVDLETMDQKKKNYKKNKPILHRKETFIAIDHPFFKKFENLTKQEEMVGLYNDVKTIGFEENWKTLLEEKQMTIVDHQIKNINETQEVAEPLLTKPSYYKTNRHKTAIARSGFSRPIQTLFQNDIFKDKKTTLFDYGCGLADDVRELQQLEIKANGWDPAHFPNQPVLEADIVNLGFVLNVIESPSERIKTLQSAFQLSQRLLVVSTMIRSSNEVIEGESFEDGIVTQRYTFQKYYEQEELKDYIEEYLGMSAIPAGLGIFYIFKTDELYQEFLSERRKRKVDWTALSKLISVPTNKKTLIRKYEANKELLDNFWEFLLYLGRLPKAHEYQNESEIKAIFGSLSKGVKFLNEFYDEELLQKSEANRKEDLVFHLALSHFDKKMVFKDLPKSLQYDIKYFFTNYQNGLEEGLKKLYELGNTKTIESLCNENGALGYLDEQALYIHSDFLDDLPFILRLYVVCATKYYGTLESIDIIKIHKTTGKVTLLIYDDFENTDYPELYLRIKVALKGQKIDIFDYQNFDTHQLLYYKRKYLPVDHPSQSKWQHLDEKLRALNIPEDDYGPTKEEFEELLAAKTE